MLVATGISGCAQRGLAAAVGAALLDKTRAATAPITKEEMR
ncbi:hypothetical protein [Lichenibacterium minor]|nr:hypothetical protein [Lichenibacterium minor]